MPLDVGNGVVAVTRDLSESGMYVEIEGNHELSGTLVLEMRMPDAGLKFTAAGHVVRIEQREGHTGIAIKLDASRLEPTNHG